VQPIPFSIHIDEAVLADLRERIERTRWPEPFPEIGWQQGTDADYLRSLLAYWSNSYDWRRHEHRLNQCAHFLAQVQDIQVHLVHERAANGHGIPLILTHGWPSSFLEYLAIIPLLTDPARHGLPGPSFDVVVPSLPGYGFSQRPPRTGVDYRYVAQLWHELMQGLGYERYAAAGGDFGSGVSTYMALEKPERMLCIYLSHLEIRPYSGPEVRPLSDAECAFIEKSAKGRELEYGYLEIQSTKPQTLGFGLNDSPVGLAAWIVEKWQSWGDTAGDVDRRFGRDLLLTNIMIYWTTQTITSSMRDYFDNRPYFKGQAGITPGPKDFVSVPTGFSCWPHGLGVSPSQHDLEILPPREWVERLYNLVYWSQMPAGGHFAAIEEPQRYAADLVAFFAKLAHARHI
jgi:pimeloyl-ACP methyl ester carboxylesterase